MILIIIILAIIAICELLIFIFWNKGKQKKNRLTKQSLYKLIEMRVLNRTLSAPISTEQAVQYEYQSPFLRIEFLDSKPWMARLFALDESISIGRSKDNMICIRGEKISRCHCRITLQDNGLFLQDLGTANGTKIRRGLFRKIVLAPNQMEEIFDGDKIIIESYRMRIAVINGIDAV